ncbi:MAG: hypothetical protein LBN39_06855 [Planctomycetaceae bacterium]|jgi:hypothetical protein|nr:hypothetical protein [Planctomycetaceae bacterium]
MRYFILFVCAGFLAFSGCGQKNPDGRESITGTITLNGKPLTCSGSARIAFLPADGAGDRQSGGTGSINDGKFSLTLQDAVKPGKYIVRIEATDMYNGHTGKSAAEEPIPEMMGVPVGILPPEFNVDSKIEFEVVKGKTNVFNYDIKTDFKPDVKKIRPKGSKNAEANLK